MEAINRKDWNIETSFWDAHLTKYKTWLMEQEASPHTKRVYWSQVKQFVMYLASSNYADNTDVLNNSEIFSAAMLDYRNFLKETLKLGASSINNSLISIELFGTVLGVSIKRIEREPRRKWKSKILTESQQQMFIKSAQEQELIRDRALALVMFCAGIRISECANLNLEDIIKDAEGTKLLVRRGTNLQPKKSYLLSTEATEALEKWLADRRIFTSGNTEKALWVSQQGQRLSIAGIDFVIRRIGWQAHLELSAEILRQTGIANATGSTSSVSIENNESIKTSEICESSENNQSFAPEVDECLSLNMVKRFGVSGNSEYRKALEQLKAVR